MTTGNDCVLPGLQRLQSFSTGEAGIYVSASDLLEHQTEVTKREKQRAAFKVLIEEEASEVLKYNALRAVLKQALTPPITVDLATLTALVTEALTLAKILTKKYDLYINEHAGFLSKRTLQTHQDFYKKWLNPLDTTNDNKLKKADLTWTDATLAWFYTEFTTERMNPRRLYFLRERRLLVLLVPIIKDFGNYSSWIIWADAYVAPFLAYLGAVFFLPRLIFNLRTLFENVFDQKKMKKEARNMDPSVRFMAQWMRLWPQLMNDIGWAISGMLMCFVLIGSWQPLAIYLSVGMQFYDVLMISIRIYIDFNRFNKLVEQYNNLPLDPNFALDEKYKSLHLSYCEHLQKGIQREKNLLYLALANASVLFLAVCCSLPFMVAIYPFFPIIGAVAAICMTIINFEGRNFLNTPEATTLEELMEAYNSVSPTTRSRASSSETTASNESGPSGNGILLGVESEPEEVVVQTPREEEVMSPREYDDALWDQSPVPTNPVRKLSPSPTELGIFSPKFQENSIVLLNSSPTGITTSPSADNLVHK